MKIDQRRPDVEKVLSGLKDFQRDTVDYVFRRMYEDEDRTRRFLIADEVGLGKTLVAKGVAAKAIDKLWDTVGRIDIVYVCSNADIARQNINRLRVLAEGELPRVERLTLLPRSLRQLQDRKLNFVSFTPGTSFDLHSRGGIAEERVLIYWILREGWGLGGVTGPKNFLQASSGVGNFRSLLDYFDPNGIDKDLAQTYLRTLAKHPEVQQKFEELAGRFTYARKRTLDEQGEQYTLIGQLRRLLAESCLSELEPDLIILDEFQRFRDLLDGEDEAADLAQALFNYKDARTLLLSATPYKMYTMYHESETDDHYSDFVRTAGFLFDSPDETQAFKESLSRYRQEMLKIGSNGTEGLVDAKGAVERSLRRVMVRTERLPVTARGDGMVTESRDDLGTLEVDDLDEFAFLDRLASELGAGDVVEYWKSAPYLLNLMDRSGYKLKREFMDAIKHGRFGPLLAQNQQHLLAWDDILNYKPVPAGNSKLRTLMKNTVETGAWRLLWIPPSMPYYSVSEGPYAEPGVQGFTKALVFSSWQVVPKAIAMLCSYEAERQMMSMVGTPAQYSDRHSRPLQFSLNEKGEPERMANLVLLYPCLTLATEVDPLGVSVELAAKDAAACGTASGGLSDESTEGAPYSSSDQLTDRTPFKDEDPPPVEAVVAEVRRRVESLLRPILDEHASSDRSDDTRWYWAALGLLDAEHYEQDVLAWLDGDGDAEELSWAGAVAESSDGDEDTNLIEHVRLFTVTAAGHFDLGQPPADLVDVLTSVAMASPAVVSLRSLLRMTGKADGSLEPSGVPQDSAGTILAALTGAAKMALGFKTLLNIPESIALVRGNRSADEYSYWRGALEYSLLGNLQSTMDEYCHVLREYLGLVGHSSAEVASQIADEVANALSMRAVNLSFDEVTVNLQTGHPLVDEHTVRCRFAMRFGDARDDETGAETRADQVRRAFNSPFRPFILASTSIGQEGLDFHQYCHEIYHWNLPSNPVDLEQREGRIHRYKGHVIRKNVALIYALPKIGWMLGREKLNDPWEALFNLACEARKSGTTDLVPYWIYEGGRGGSQVIRHMPALPLSHEVTQKGALTRTLAVYRMVFGQPRQEDLVGYLTDRAAGSGGKTLASTCRVDLRPDRKALATDQVDGKGITSDLRTSPHGRSTSCSVDWGPEDGVAGTVSSVGRVDQMSHNPLRRCGTTGWQEESSHDLKK